MPVTIKDVARISGVSISTVSRVINDSKPVSSGIREKVFRVIEDTGYVLNPVARSLVMKKSQLLESMKLIRKGLNPSLQLLGVLPTMMDSRTTLSGQVYNEVKKHFPDKIFKNTIPRNIRLAEAPSHGTPVGAYDRFSKGARAYKALTKEIIERIEQ